ncbi:hypothetical protein D7S89_02750 [Trinickia fusca]|uniref:Glycosyl transferase family 28 C-terminal domain-containing protein n=1 Tax=Trinickia fusca TaxID=2419777 RepID=A0A494XP80_9BURK|nr:hypothetical protein D7S89_02750 [Trinickia fusca]
MFYVFDGGSGIGHLRRLARIAEAMRDDFSCLIVSGHNVGPQWIVPQGCEYVRLPAWDNLIATRAAYWGGVPFLDVPLDEAVALRSAILLGVVEGFQPDVIFVDHLPLGAHEELVPVLNRATCRKYLVTRGIQNETEDLQRLVLGGAALAALGDDYHRIFSAIDTRVFDLASRYDLPSKVADKILSTGYVAPSVAAAEREAVRSMRGLAGETPWVVASAGSGQWGEPLIEACIALAQDHPDVHFDIVMGPRSRLSRPDTHAAGRIRLHASCPELAALHAAADVVITAGGYNSLLEAIQGQARILCIPYRKDRRDEPFDHATRLQAYVDIRIATEIGDLEALLQTAIEAGRKGPVQDRRAELRMDGAARIAQAVRDDLTMHPDDASPSLERRFHRKSA